jgi:hypothetical protein
LKPYVLMSRLSLEVIISMNRALHDLFLLF